MSTDRMIPPSWDRVGRHAVFPEARHDEVARFNFLTNLNVHLSSQVIPGVREAYELRAEPEFRKQRERSPETRHEVRKLMSQDSYYQAWSALRRSTMEMRQQAGRSLVLRQIEHLNAEALKLNQNAATLELDASQTLPDYVSAVDTHCMPGSYHTSLTQDDISAGANYDCGLFVTTAGLLGSYADGGGKAIAEWLQKEHPQFKPKRILDIGTTIGHNIVPIAQAFPDAEVIAVDVSAPVLRYGHARARALGVTNLHFVQANGEDLSRYADGSFDLITTSMFWHETSTRSMPRILTEISRLLAPGGLTINLEQPQYTGRPVFEQFMRDWDTYNNNEPFWGTMHELDLESMLEKVGLPKSTQFQIKVAPSVDERIFPRTQHDSGTEDYGRAPAWDAFGAWKPNAKEAVA